MSFGLIAAAPAGAQGFGANKEKVTLQRKLPALIHLPGETIKVIVTSADEDGALPYDFQALLETELLKDDPNLRDDDNPSRRSSVRSPNIRTLNHLHNKLGSGQAVGASNSPLSQLSKTAAKIGATERITGKIDVSFQAKDATAVY